MKLIDKLQAIGYSTESAATDPRSARTAICCMVQAEKLSQSEIVELLAIYNGKDPCDRMNYEDIEARDLLKSEGLICETIVKGRDFVTGCTRTGLLVAKILEVDQQQEKVTNAPKTELKYVPDGNTSFVTAVDLEKATGIKEQDPVKPKFNYAVVLFDEETLQIGFDIIPTVKIPLKSIKLFVGDSSKEELRDDMEISDDGKVLMRKSDGKKLYHMILTVEKVLEIAAKLEEERLKIKTAWTDDDAGIFYVEFVNGKSARIDLSSIKFEPGTRTLGKLKYSTHISDDGYSVCWGGSTGTVLTSEELLAIIEEQENHD